ncbi:LPS export ABC transporter ATP-binding protein [Mucisphaera sp.]|uniref:LPS export ABC transporter ATP-binding protein n=1 Tax=Mucisphaera sp. TaxID=2913024 RepID=UPI003D0E568C
MSLLNVQGLHKTFGSRPVVSDVSFRVGEGEIVGLLGRNGAGKTTSFRMTMGMIRPDKGSVLFHEKDVSKTPMYRRAQLGMGYLAQEPSIFQRLTVEQNLKAILETRPLSRPERRDRCEELMAQFGLTKLRKQPARTLSGGERRKLEIARALISEPTLILLDEPFSGVDPKAVEDLQIEVRRLRSQRDISILITDHNVQRTLEIVDRAYVLADGKLLAEGTPRELINNEAVRDSYLGSMFKGDEFDEEPGLNPPELSTPTP